MSDERRERYAAAIKAADTSDEFNYRRIADAAMAVADEEHATLLANVKEWREDAEGWKNLAHKRVREVHELEDDNARLRAELSDLQAIDADRLKLSEENVRLSEENGRLRAELDEAICRQSEYADRAIANGQQADQRAATIDRMMSAAEKFGDHGTILAVRAAKDA